MSVLHCSSYRDKMNCPKANRPTLILFVLSAIAVVQLIATNEVTQQQDQPFWQYVLREFVFRTISSHQPDDDLYKKILDAPFYGGPLPEATNDEDALLSRGSVFRLPNERWILCQDDCETCDFCEKRKDPIVKWVLRRVRRWTKEGTPKWDLQLTVLPQLDKIFQNGQPPHQAVDNYAYVMRENVPSTAEIQVSSTTDQPTVWDELRRKNDRLEGRMEGGPDTSEIEQDDWMTHLLKDNDVIRKPITIKTQARHQYQPRKMRSRNVAKFRKRQLDDRPIRRSDPLEFYYPQVNDPSASNPTSMIREEAIPRLIIGIDQHGEKHLVHVVPIKSPLENEEQFEYPPSRLYKKLYSPRVSRMARPISNEDAYDKLIDRVLDSFSMNRNFIETFLFSDRLVLETPKKLGVFPYPSYSGIHHEDERFQSRNDDVRDRSLSFQRANDYSMNSEYHLDENNQQSRRYTDMSKVLNRRNSVYQDQSLLAELEPYDLSTNDQRHDERSTSQLDADRKRRNSRGKLIHSPSIFDHQRVGENNSKVNETVFSVERKIGGNTTDQELNHSQFLINHTQSRV